MNMSKMVYEDQLKFPKKGFHALVKLPSTLPAQNAKNRNNTNLDVGCVRIKRSGYESARTRRMDKALFSEVVGFLVHRKLFDDDGKSISFDSLPSVWPARSS